MQGSGGGSRTVSLSCGDAARLGGRLEIAALSPVGRRLRAGVEAVAIFASLTSRRLHSREDFASLRLGCVDFANWVVLRHGTNVTRVTCGENIFNNIIYIGDLASTNDVRCPAAKYRDEYQEVPAKVMCCLTMRKYMVRLIAVFGKTSTVLEYFL